MAEKSELLRLPIFAGLPEDQIEWFIGCSQELVLKSGDSFMHQGEPADSMFVVLDGQQQARGEIGGEVVTLTGKLGDVTGVLPYSRMKEFPITGRSFPSRAGPLLTAACCAFPHRHSMTWCRRCLS
jgi:hypothetical protein